MSVTVSATPIILLSFSKIVTFVASSVAVGGFAAVANGASAIKNATQVSSDFTVINERVKQLINDNTNTTSSEVINLICKEYDTAFVDKDLLLKTLEEHGFENIQSNGDNIMCKSGVLRIDFYRDSYTILDNESKEPYTMKVTAECDENEIAELVNDLSSEYTANTQEESYIKIKERLDEKGLKIDEEEIYEDNTIVLTVNLD